MGQWETLPVPAAPSTLTHFGASQQCLVYADVSRSMDEVLWSLAPEEETWEWAAAWRIADTLSQLLP